MTGDRAGATPAADLQRTDTEPEYGERWVYESIVEAVPGVDLSERVAVAVQFLGFEAAAIAMAAVYGLWSALPAATVAIGVAAAGSVLMQRMARHIRQSGAPVAYRRALLGSSIEVVLGLLSFFALVTYLFVVDPRPGPLAGLPLGSAEEPLLASVLGERPPALVVYLVLVVTWDVCYRIGTGWWAAVVAAWRSFRYDLTGETARHLRAADRLTLAFGTIQLALVPFLWGHPVLLLAVVGHVAAVVAVVGVALVRVER